MKRKINGDKVIEIIAYLILIAFCIAIAFPIMQVVTISMSPPHVINKIGFHFVPTEFDWTGYKQVLGDELVWNSYKNTLIRTALGLGVSLLISVLGAYPLSKKNLPNRRFWMTLFVFTMYFSGGMIPTYLLVKKIGIIDTVWALVLPSALNVYNLIILRNFFEGIPNEIEESAKLDGAGSFQVLFLIVLPLAKAVLATVALWVGVASWNDWFQCMIYIHDDKKYVLQYILRRILTQGLDPNANVATNVEMISTEATKMAALVVTMVPILCVYPFLQKYFVKGVMLGAVKG